MVGQIDKLHALAHRPSRRIIGLMSGTSLDGLDVALCEVEGSGLKTHLSLRYFTTVPYDESLREDIRRVFARRQVDFQHLCLLNARIGILHGRMVRDCLADWKVPPAEVDLVASHGQTVFHAPQRQHGLENYPNATLQIGDGDHVATATGIITVSDFRQKHIAGGGEGAPLAVYGDYLLFSKKGENRILLNIGGIANFTHLPTSQRAADVFTTDTGPGNTLLDAFARRYFGEAFDRNGERARAGRCHSALLESLKDDPFFEAGFPKTTGPEVFDAEYVLRAQERSHTQDIPPSDLLATLAHFSADTIAGAVTQATGGDGTYTLYTSGGGAHNSFLLECLGRRLPGAAIRDMEELGVPGDAKEAVLFAVLANETVAGAAIDFGGRDGVPGLTMGKVSFPAGG